MMLSKFADGITDVFFGSLIDKTKSKMGKARPWMLWSYLGNAVMLVAIFAIPKSLGDTAKYAYFFIAYTLLNAVFYTANNIAYASLTSLITRNNNERVQVGSIRFMFSLATNLIVASVTVGLVGKLGGGAMGWRNVAIIYALIGLIVNTISVFSVKEGVDEDEGAEKKEEEEKLTLLESAKLLVKNKYYLMIVAVYILTYIQTGIAGIGI
jgi:GPH family glycoside/pentoside/hexuronide:cation symporter